MSHNSLEGGDPWGRSHSFHGWAPSMAPTKPNSQAPEALLSGPRVTRSTEGKITEG